MDMPLAHLVCAGRDHADHMRLGQAVGGLGEPEVTVGGIGAEAADLEILLLQMADMECLRRGAVDIGHGVLLDGFPGAYGGMAGGAIPGGEYGEGGWRFTHWTCFDLTDTSNGRNCAWH